jgi:7-carboxy-7-deazaguanine synthase
MQVRYNSRLMTLNITELFRSVQGETSYTGIPTFFVRLAACNLRCRWCDTPYSFPRGEPTSIDDIIEQIENSGCRYVCITGGEPLLQKEVHTLMKQLADRGFILSLETGGSLTIKDVDPRVKVILDIKCPGSLMDAKNDWTNIPLLKSTDEIKFVIADRKDYDWTKSICARYRLWSHTVLFSPVHGELDPRELVSWILEDKLPARLNMQLHKYIWGATVKGV